MLICEKTVPTDCVNQPFPNLIFFQMSLFCFYFGKFANSLLNYPQKISLQNLKPLFSVRLQIFCLKCYSHTSFKNALVKFSPIFMRTRPPPRKQKTQAPSNLIPYSIKIAEGTKQDVY